MDTRAEGGLRARARAGQAFMELAVGMLATALVVAALFGCTYVILASLDLQRPLRAEAGRAAMASSGGDASYSSAAARDVVRVEDFAAKHLFGTTEVEVHEEVHLPAMGGIP